ncbi:MAG TPA: hypothetical protein VFP21_13080 [Solirubrobacterales bacterium]|nr:hypothetical protein [Solirubrobacterales bacterium]
MTIDPPSFEVKSQDWLKRILVLGAAFLAVFALSWAWQAYREPLTILRVIAGLAALLLAGFVGVCLRLIRFMSYMLEVGPQSVTIWSPRGNQSFGWADLRLRHRRALRVLELRDREGKLLFAVDDSATNARRLWETGVQRIGAEG